ncbi:MAG: hypothetical protein NTW29_09720 [Bacteroidetes bacterium]|nr:hypothetical protein [Bacteroidota bacterium]
MDKNFSPLVDEHLQSLQGMQESATDDFFYTRLMARMERKESNPNWNFPLKPVWLAGALTILLVINGLILVQQNRGEKKTSASSIQDVASSYDQSISTY